MLRQTQQYVKAQNGHSLHVFTSSTLHSTMITLLEGLSDNQEKRRSGTKNIYLPKEMGQTKAAAAEVEEVGQDLRSAKPRPVRPVCVKGKAKDSKEVGGRLWKPCFFSSNGIWENTERGKQCMEHRRGK